MAYRVKSLNGKLFASKSHLKIQLLDGTTTELKVQFRHWPHNELKNDKGRIDDFEMYDKVVVSIDDIEDENGQLLDPVAAVPAVRADEWMVAALITAYQRERGESWRRAFGD